MSGSSQNLKKRHIQSTQGAPEQKGSEGFQVGSTQARRKRERRVRFEGQTSSEQASASSAPKPPAVTVTSAPAAPKSSAPVQLSDDDIKAKLKLLINAICADATTGGGYSSVDKAPILKNLEDGFKSGFGTTNPIYMKAGSSSSIGACLSRDGKLSLSVQSTSQGTDTSIGTVHIKDLLKAAEKSVSVLGNGSVIHIEPLLAYVKAQKDVGLQGEMLEAIATAINSSKTAYSPNAQTAFDAALKEIESAATTSAASASPLSSAAPPTSPTATPSGKPAGNTHNTASPTGTAPGAASTGQSKPDGQKPEGGKPVSPS
ncbi:MAG: hypothetical protein EBX40_05275 [Gammaproteobacteria bacterium]|nr:hypothetical protein [Gammaproteobacteria bacterium]